jgi:Flp pilus assembly pilin Flp
MRDTIDTILILLKTDRRGVTAVEYAVIAGAVAAVIATAFGTLGSHISSGLATVGSQI